MSEAEISRSVTSEELVVFAVTGPVLTARIRAARFGADAGPKIAKRLPVEMGRLEPTPRFVVLDFSDTEFISSAGLGACLTMFQHVQERGGTMAVYGLRKDVRTLFEITGIDGVLNVVNTPEELAAIVAD